VECPVENDSFTLSISLAEGMNTIDVTAADQAGNIKTESVIVHVDTSSPLINISTPQNNAVLNTPTITVSGRADDVHLSSVKINGQTASLSNNEFSLSTLSLQEGENQVQIEAGDGAGNVSHQFLTVTLDTAAPEITHIIPADQTTGVPLSTGIQVELSEPVDEATLSDLTFYLETNGQKIDGSITQEASRVVFHAAGSLPDSSQITIHVTAGIKDRAGNGLQNPYTGVFSTPDTTAPGVPQVEVLPETTSLKKITVNGTAESGAAISISGGFNLVEGLCDNGGHFSIEVSLKTGSIESTVYHCLRWFGK